MKALFFRLCFVLLLPFTMVQSFAAAGFLPPDQAFRFSAQSISPTQAELKWSIAPHYYLYHDQFKVTVAQTPVKLSLPKGKEKQDPTFGLTNVHYNQVLAQFKVKPDTEYLVSWQGCSEDGLCYPLQRKTIRTDESGLLPQSALPSSPGKLLSSQTSTLFQNTNEVEEIEKPQKSELEPKGSLPDTTQTIKSEDIKPLTLPEKKPAEDQSLATTEEKPQSDLEAPSSSAETIQTQSVTSSALENSQSSGNDSSSHSSGLTDQLNNDQLFFSFLNRDQLFMNALVFFGLGILLAFLPCSLPLIPILSGIILQRASGYKAVIIALSFIVSMALVYSVLGIVVAEIGYSFQRWFQSPVITVIFALLFILLALNLFGLYQLSLPQSVMQKLGNVQNRQKGGTVISAAIMGALSALIVGPCMSAPLAGALLFVSQSHSAALGGMYLFILGLGMGLPLFIASVFGSRLLPQPGAWMDRLKICFGFVMLMVALYFIRPLLPVYLYFAIFALLLFSVALYLLFYVPKTSQNIHKVLMCSIAVLTIGWGVFQIKHSIEDYQSIHSQQELLSWTRVTTQEELDTAITAAKLQHRPILLDTYADWCVACQPIEKQVFPRADVQQALNDFSLIKLDLTHYHSSQDVILKNREILGPPTLLILNAEAQELRQLRLTGTFTAKQLLEQLSQAKNAGNH